MCLVGDEGEGVPYIAIASQSSIRGLSENDTNLSLPAVLVDPNSMVVFVFTLITYSGCLLKPYKGIYSAWYYLR